jgi:hypothetical protein
MGHDKSKYAPSKVIAAASRATQTPPAKTADLVKGLADADSGVRYWSAIGLMLAGEVAALGPLLKDPAECVRVAAAEGLAKHGSESQGREAMEVLVELADQDRHGVYTSMLALNSIDSLGPKGKAYKERIAKLPRGNKSVNARMTAYVGNLIDHISM